MKLKGILQRVGRIIFSVLEIVVLYVVIGYFISFFEVNSSKSQSPDVTIYVMSNGVHTDLVLPISTAEKDWSKQILFTHTAGKDTNARYVAFGWGDKGFYLNTPSWSELKFSTAFKAAFALSQSAIHTTFYSEIVEGDKCVKIDISNDNYRQLVQYIEQSFEKGKNGAFIHIPTTATYGQTDAFYDAVGTYNLFYTCNSWANDGLKASAQKASLWTLMDSGIFYHYRSEIKKAAADRQQLVYFDSVTGTKSRNS